MANELYFCGAEMYNCFGLIKSGLNSQKTFYDEPCLIENVANAEFTQFYTVYQKTGDYSWYVKGLGLPTKETQIFTANHHVMSVALTKNMIVGHSEDGLLYQIRFKFEESVDNISLSELDILKIPCNQISSNEDHVYVLQSSAESSAIFQLMSTNDVEDSLKCIAEFPNQKIIDISVGHGHFVCLSDTGGVWNWGNCGRSEVSSNQQINVMKECEKPLRVEFFDDLPCKIVAISCGGWHSLALTSDGDIYSWGWNESEQLGLNSSGNVSSSGTNLPTPIDLGSAEDPVIGIATGSRHSAALLESGRVFTWGCNKQKQLGLGNHFTADQTGEPKEIRKCWKGMACKLKCGTWSTFIQSE